MHLAARALEAARPWRTFLAETGDRVAAANPLVRAVLASAREPAVRAPRHKRRGRSTGVRAHAERVPRTAVLRPRHPALARRRRDRARRPHARPAARTCWCPHRRDRRRDDPRHRKPRSRNGPARALTPKVTPGPTV